MILGVQFPVAGLNRRYAYQQQPPFTTPDCLNVRPFGYGERQRGGSRPNLVKAFETQVSANPIRLLANLRYIASNAPTNAIVTAAGGNVYWSGGSTPAGNGFSYWSGMTLTAAGGGLNVSSTQDIQAVDYQGKLYIADWDPDATISANARQPKIFDPATGNVTNWAASVTDGTLPKGCPCIALYRGRIFLAGARSDPHNWFSCRLDDPFDWDYSQQESTAAISGNNPEGGGKVAEPISCLAPHGISSMIFGCPNSLWVMRGDPGEGGKLVLIDKRNGVIGPSAWCHVPANADGSGPRMFVYLSADGVYAVPAEADDGVAALSVSRERLPAELRFSYNTSNSFNFCLAWDAEARGIHIFVTPITSGPTTHWFLDWTTKGFFPAQYSNSDHDPFKALEVEATQSSNHVLLGCRDGYIRRHNPTTIGSNQDDGSDFTSYVLLGPFHAGEQGSIEGVLNQIQAELEIVGEGATVTWEVRGGWSAETALTGTFTASGTFSDGVNRIAHPRVRGTDFYVRLSSTKLWLLERLQLTIQPHGRRRFIG